MKLTITILNLPAAIKKAKNRSFKTFIVAFFCVAANVSYGQIINSLKGTNQQPLTIGGNQICFDKHGNLFAVFNNTIVKIAPKTGEIIIVAGTGEAGYTGDGGRATDATLNGPSAICVDNNDILYIADTYNNAVREVASGGIFTIAGGPDGFHGGEDGGGYTATQTSIARPTGICIDSKGNIFVGDNDVHARVLMIRQNVAYEVAGGYFQVNGVSVFNPNSFWADANDNIYFTDTGNFNGFITTNQGVIYKMTENLIGVNTIARIAGHDPGTAGSEAESVPAVTAILHEPTGVSVDAAGNVYYSDNYLNRVRKIDVNTGLVATFAGNGTEGYTGDGGFATDAELDQPAGIAVDDKGNVFIADGNGVIRVVGNLVQQTVVFPAFPPTSFSNQNITLAATSSSGLQIIYTSSDPTVASIITQPVAKPVQAKSAKGLSSANTTVSVLHVLKAGITNITASQPGDTTYAPAASVTQKLTISRGAQAITFADITPKKYAAGSFTLAATSSSGLPVTYTSSDTTIAKVSSTAAVSIRKVGTVQITAFQAGSSNYLAATPVVKPLSILPGDNIITFAAIAAKPYGTADFTLAATAGSKLAVSYTSADTSVAVIIAPNKVHIKKAGTSTITAGQAGSTLYSAAAPVSQLLTVNKAAQAITFAALTAKVYGAADYALTATASSTLPVTYTSSNPAVATVSGSTVHITGAGTTSITAGQAGNGNYNAATPVIQPLTVSKATQVITFVPPAKTYGDADFTLTATSGSGLPVTVTSGDTTIATINAAGLVHIKKAASVLLTASQAGNANYNAATLAKSLVIAREAQTITFADITPKKYAAGSFTLAATSSSGLPVTYTSSDTTIAKVSSTAAVSIRKVGTVQITAFQAGSSNYLAATPVVKPLSILPGDNIITFAAIAAKPYGTADFTLAATAGSKLAVSYTSADTSVAVIIAPNKVHIKKAGTSTITAGQAGSTLYSAAAPVSQLLTVNKAAQAITFAALTAKVYGAADYALTATASSTLPVTYTSSNPAVATVSGTTVHITGAGTTSITAGQAGNGNYNAATPVIQPLTISKATQVITFAPPAKTYGDADFTLTATSGSGLPVTVTSGDTTIATINAAGLVHIKRAASVVLTASQAGNANYNAATLAKSLVIAREAQTITFADITPKKYAAGSFTLAATSSSGLPVTYTSSDTTIAKVSSTAAVSIRKVGTVQITAFQAGSSNYLAATPVVKPLSILPGDNIITFAAIAAKPYGTADFTLAATAGSKLAVSYTSADTSVAVIIAPNKVHIKKAGTSTITAGQAGSTLYSAAAPVSQLLTVNKAAQAITFAALTAKVYGAADYALTATASSTLPVTYTSSNPAVATVSGTTVHITGAGTTSITAGQAGNGNYNAATPVIQPLTISKATQVITFAPPAKTYGDADFTLTATSGSGLPVTVTSGDTTIATINAAGLVHIKRAASVVLTASQAGNANYNAATLAKSLVIAREAQTITFADITPKKYAAGSFTLAATSSSGLPVTYISSDTTIAKVSSTAAVSIRKVGTVQITAFQAGSSNYLAATPVVKPLSILPGDNIITFAAIAAKPYGTADFTLAATAGSKLAVSYTSADTSVAVIIAPNKVHIKKAGTSTITAGQAGSTLYSAAAPVSQLLTVNKAAQAITFAALTAKVYGAADYALTATASSTLPVTYTSSNPAVATVSGSTVHITGAGTTSITAGQAGNGNYNAATPVIQPLTVSKATQVITFVPPAKTYGDADFTLTATSGSGLPVTVTSGDTTIATINAAGLVHIKKAASVLLTASQAGNANYNAATAKTATLTIARAALTITADNKTKVAGAANPALTVTYKGFVYGNTSSALTTLPLISTTATTASPTGSYPITARNAVAVNYVITYVAGTLTVTVPGTNDLITKNLVEPYTAGNATPQPAPVVHPSVSPNGDGINDVLTIENIASYPDNKLMLLTKSGGKIFEIMGYDNASRVFDGRSSQGKLQQAGTYFYLLSYRDKDGIKQKTGFIVLKY